jgi:hypothetical protein
MNIAVNQQCLSDTTAIPAVDRVVTRSDNHPPAITLAERFMSPAIDSARMAYTNTAAFLRETPVIENHVQAKTAANFFEQARKTIQDLEAERRRNVDPLNEEVKRINDCYRTPRSTLENIRDEVGRRMKVFADAEEAKRAAEAEAAVRAAQEAERIAREAEDREREARDDADNGAVVDVVRASAEADIAFTSFQQKAREAVRADKAVNVRLDGGFDRAVSMRKNETLVLDDAFAALKAMGVNDKVREAILSAARAYRKLNGSLPEGVRAETERKF